MDIIVSMKRIWQKWKRVDYSVLSVGIVSTTECTKIF